METSLQLSVGFVAATIILLNQTKSNTVKTMKRKCIRSMGSIVHTSRPKIEILQ